MFWILSCLAEINIVMPTKNLSYIASVFNGQFVQSSIWNGIAFSIFEFLGIHWFAIENQNLFFFWLLGCYTFLVTLLNGQHLLKDRWLDWMRLLYNSYIENFQGLLTFASQIVFWKKCQRWSKTAYRNCNII